MAVCANCSRALQQEWKFCIYCGTPTGVENAESADAPEPAEPHETVLRVEDIPADEPDPEPAASGADAAPVAHVNILAVLALILGCLVSPLAALFGHLALSQIGKSGERGTAIAWVAIVLGYLSLATLLVLGITYLVLNA